MIDRIQNIKRKPYMENGCLISTTGQNEKKSLMTRFIIFLSLAFLGIFVAGKMFESFQVPLEWRTWIAAAIVVLCALAVLLDSMFPFADKVNNDPEGTDAEDTSGSEPIVGGLSHKYFLSYSFQTNRSSGYGCAEVSTSQPIQSMSDISLICDGLKKTMQRKNKLNIVSVVVLNWKPFDAASPDGSKEPVPEEVTRVVLRLVA